ncbi:FecCD family ABC transporter permease [Salirhabdus salicampi]|uniref:FecCD family ABC transporter permease n=1 Tax=Salirhabdus salicampi TaxID=476102 RepID=UPI0020C23B92|nr:iron ABC transporter permease [Salirhabdus salicampi]MCP8615305.1 iron ABC transporter permease [Salirhabdus salicampi]
MSQFNLQAGVSRKRQWITYAIGIMLLMLSLLSSISVGAYQIDFASVIASFFTDETTQGTLIIHDVRLPRAVIGMIIGMNLAIAGAIMQSITKNPLASPQIFGVNAGASLMIVIVAILLPNFSQSWLIYFAFLGAAVGGFIVYSMASYGGMTPVKLALAGITVHLFLTSIIEGMIIFHEHSTEDVLFWLAGSLSGRDWDHVQMILPWTLIGIIGAMFLSKSFTLLSLGDDVAKGLGQKIAFIRIASAIIVIILAGSSVAVAGPIGFIGLMIPHIARKLVGVDYRHVIPCSALLGAVLLVGADVLSRFISFPSESPVGIVTALIGGPFFLYLARREGR